MEYYLGTENGSGMKFDNINDLLDAISDLAETYAENGEDVFEVNII